MHTRIIKKIDRAIFSLRWLAEKNPLIMNFNPIINKYQLTGDFVLIHWQAKPKFLRTWGLYDSNTDQYHCLNTQLAFPSIAAKLVDVDERIINTVPTAMILYSNCKYILQENRIKQNESTSNSSNSTNGNNSTNNNTVETVPKNNAVNKKG